MSIGDWIALTAALAGVAAAVAAVAAVWYQVGLARGTSSIDNTVRMEVQWRSPEMLMSRAGAADAIIHERGQTDDVLTVMTFFEQLGYLVKAKAIRAEAAWEAFSDWSLPHSEACKPFVAQQQKVNITYWENFVDLNREIVAVEARRRGLTPETVTPNAATVHTFLVDESSLTTGGGQSMRRTWRLRKETGSVEEASPARLKN